MVCPLLMLLSLAALLSCYQWDRHDNFENSLAKGLGLFFAFSTGIFALASILSALKG